MSQLSDSMQRIHDAEDRDRTRNGGAVCPRCGNRWDNPNPLVSSIRGTRVKGFWGFGKVPGYRCEKCGCEWRMK